MLPGDAGAAATPVLGRHRVALDGPDGRHVLLPRLVLRHPLLRVPGRPVGGALWINAEIFIQMV